MQLRPKLKPDTYAFVEVENVLSIPPQTIAVFQEDEGTTAIMPKNVAVKLNLKIVFEAAWIALTADTDLTDKGITAAFSQILADNNISCNVFAPINHDHIFVPYEDRQRTLELLEGIRL